MLVCPSCRSENIEEAAVCRHCGNALETTSSPMRRIERSEEDEAQYEYVPPRKTSPWPLVITGLVVGLGLLGWGLFSALRPNPCAGKYSSALFAYCAKIPQGWVGGSSPNPGGDLDRYVSLAAPEEPPAQSTGEPEADASAEPPVEIGSPVAAEPRVNGGATVQVSLSLDPTVSTPQYAQTYQTSQRAVGLETSPFEEIIIDGEQAVSWEYTIPPDAGEGPLHNRMIILVRPDGIWEIRFWATDEGYEEARFGLQQLLETWRWKA